eukprot:Pgem_evm1s606
MNNNNNNNNTKNIQGVKKLKPVSTQQVLVDTMEISGRIATITIFASAIKEIKECTHPHVVFTFGDQRMEMEEFSYNCVDEKSIIESKPFTFDIFQPL